MGLLAGKYIISKDVLGGLGCGVRGFFYYLWFLFYLSLTIQGLHKATMCWKINLKSRKGSCNVQVWQHQHPSKWKRSLAEDPANEVVQALPQAQLSALKGAPVNRSFVTLVFNLMLGITQAAQVPPTVQNSSLKGKKLLSSYTDIKKAKGYIFNMISKNVNKHQVGFSNACRYIRLQVITQKGKARRENSTINPGWLIIWIGCGGSEAHGRNGSTSWPL